MDRISDRRSLISWKWPITLGKDSLERERFAKRVVDLRLAGHFAAIVTGSSSRCDNATVKLSRARKILSQFKFERDDPLEVFG